ncbi:SDR family oxidoreductase [Amycolatopsis sp. NPDC005961]|uniref:SDR family NAD(P)-dependent oxidoreductase n=1 Tax=Amycolatopsis sp. NPDC005961 TaxID=3156720 RepID=UPI0033FC5BB1
MRAAGGGAIVNNASTAAFFGTAFSAAYSASKHGVVGLSKSAAAEYGAAGIRVNVLNPGVTETPQTGPWLDSVPGERDRVAGWNALKRLARPEEVAEAAAWLLSDRASMVDGSDPPRCANAAVSAPRVLSRPDPRRRISRGHSGCPAPVAHRPAAGR